MSDIQRIPFKRRQRKDFKRGGILRKIVPTHQYTSYRCSVFLSSFLQHILPSVLPSAFVFWCERKTGSSMSSYWLRTNQDVIKDNIWTVSKDITDYVMSRDERQKLLIRAQQWENSNCIFYTDVRGQYSSVGKRS